MQLVQYLMCVATRHEQAKDEHEEESKELWLKLKKNKTRQTTFTLTYENEIELLKGVIGSVRGKPTSLKKLPLPAIGCLAYILTANVANEPFIEGHEIVNKLVYDPEKTIVYLHGIAELKEKGWIKLIEAPSMAFTDQPPFCWLQWRIELGDTFHKEMGAMTQDVCRTFKSNDAYLDAVFQYLQVFIRDDSDRYRINDPEADLSTFLPEGWVRRIAMGVQSSTCDLPTADAQERYSLSVFQHLTMVGLLGRRDGDLSYEFSDVANVTRLFARGRVCRKRMKEHLFGEKSPLVRQRLLEGTQGTFGESVQLTQHGLTALLGKHTGKNTAQLAKRVKKNTLFDIEEPKIKKESVLLPPLVMEAIQSLLFSESREGKQIRKSWHASLPAAWGSPTGSTVLLYGSPGTGKSLTAQYLASELKLPLLKIDASRVLSCWIGESEQNVRRIFDDYSMLQKELGNAPVLLLNEADQLLGARGAGSHAVDRMNNNMQALFLEGLERFSGILVATTNRRDILDEAFSRRFTYKLELPTPDKNLRMELWKSHLPMERLAPDLDIADLADLNLTGGEIRLVIERVVRLLAYRGVTTIDRKILMGIAREELASRMKRYGNVKIGFGAGQNNI